MSTGPDQAQWFLVHCKPRQDERALENLERQGFYCYYPRRFVEKLRDGRRSTVTEPLFPGYVFIRLNRVSDNWHPIYSTRGVHQIVRFNQQPLPVREQIIEQIRCRLAGQARPEPYFKPGDRVQITHGPFSQLEAVFLTNDGTERVVVLLSMLQHEQPLTFHVSAVRKRVSVCL